MFETAELGCLRGRGDCRRGELPMLSELARTAGSWLPPDRPDPQPTPRPIRDASQPLLLGVRGMATALVRSSSPPFAHFPHET